MTSDILSLDELCIYLKLSKQAAYKLVQRKRIPSFKVGRQLRFRKSKLDDWIEKEEQKRSHGPLRKTKGRRQHASY